MRIAVPIDLSVSFVPLLGTTCPTAHARRSSFRISTFLTQTRSLYIPNPLTLTRTYQYILYI